VDDALSWCFAGADPGLVDMINLAEEACGPGTECGAGGQEIIVCTEASRVKVDRSLPCSDGGVERLEVDRVVSDPVIDRYVTYLTVEGGLTPGTVRLHRRQLRDGLTRIISMVLGARGPGVRPGSGWICTPG